MLKKTEDGIKFEKEVVYVNTIKNRKALIILLNETIIKLLKNN